ncbi:hypothetical protein QBC38DRAFT_506404 [Podospora fimiseda]|uniref:Polynucleotide 5'-hydroxyl-kinase GRC3 n=1 Tax=Podospora fimiseda TaxID=252190 RepID=A0AAN7BZX5_9PEZI|nr:hypothetical protein QBC38DRAFT_506404 [Podospora fimiseda]
MATNKRRKLDGENSPASPATPVMSAFQRLRALQAASKEKAVEEKASSSSSENVVQPGESETTPDRAFPRRKKRGPAAATVQQDAAPLIMDDDPNLEMQGDSIPPTPILSPLPGTPRLEATTIKPRQIIQHSSFKPNKKNFQSKLDGQIRILTSDGERLVVLGSFGIKVEEGEATIAGATLTPLDPIQWVHAPHCHALPVLRTSEGTIIELHPHPGAQSLRQLAKLNPVFGKLWNESDATFQIIFSSDDVPKKVSLQELVSAPEWNKKLAGLVKAKRESSSKSTNPPIIFLCGPKSSGKSTFGRLLANRLITDRAGSRSNPWTPILLLDIDPGQPEFSPPGVISLVKLSQPNLSPSFCHPSTEFTVKSHAIAAVTPALDPDHFLQCVLDLFYVYQQLHSSQLLIINTPGWIQGTGLDILSSLITSLVPTEVIYLSQDGPEDTVATLQTTTSAPSIFSTLPSSPLSQSQSAEPSRTALSLRIMSTLSYFHFSASTQTWTTQPLSSVPPYRVSYSPSQKGFLGVLCYDHQPSPSLLSEAINGTVLALVRIKDLAAFRPLQVKEEDIILAGEEAKIPMINNSLGTTLDPGYCELVCLVLVRGVNIERKELQLLAPPGGLGDVKGGGEYLVLVAGRFDTPVWSYSEELYKRGEEGDGFGGLGGI